MPLNHSELYFLERLAFDPCPLAQPLFSIPEHLSCLYPEDERYKVSLASIAVKMEGRNLHIVLISVLKLILFIWDTFGI